MRRNAKRFLITGLVTLMALPLLGCGLVESVESILTPAPISDAHAVALIVTAGVPYIDHYYQEAAEEEQIQATGDIGRVTATGHWSATYEGNSKWIVKGPVITKQWGECSTTWTLTLLEGESEIKLVGFSCD
jgi:hypothetical protein